MKITESQVIDALKSVHEPDLRKDIISLNLVSNIKIDDQKISFKLKISNPALHNRKRVEDACIFNLERNISKGIEVEIEFEGIPKSETDPSIRKTLPGVKNIIAVSSGKGGVGKSTVTANLAVGLVKKGYKVGLVDADIHGPSMPLMLGCEKEKPTMTKIGEKELIQPVEAHGVKLLSIGFFADPNQAIVWRGAMASKALKQMFSDANWGDLDYMIIDLPPGTGDIHLSIVQQVPLSGAIVVSTPQPIALADAKKGVNMFQLESINVPVLGIVENMSYFTPAELPENKYYIFGQEGAQNLATQLDVPLLAEIPIVQSIREAGDVGRPAVLQEGTPTSIAMDLMCANVVERVNWRNNNLEPTKIVEMTR